MARSFEEILTDSERGGAYLYVSLASGVVSSPIQQPITLDRVVVSAASLSFQMYDNASGASGTLIFDFASAPAPYAVQVGAKILNGLTIPAQALLNGKITIVYRPI